MTTMIPKGKKLKVVETSRLAGANIYAYYHRTGTQDVLAATIGANETVYFGPYYEDSLIRFANKSSGAITTSFVGADQQIPTALYVALTTAQYAAITPDPNTIYLITDA